MKIKRIIELIIGKIVFSLDNCKSVYMATRNKKLVDGKDVMISSEVTLKYPKNIHIGKGTYINGGMIFASRNAEITIGDRCLISYNVHIRTSTHNYSKKNTLIQEQGELEKSITIGNDVWIGYGVQVMPGVTIADGCVIGAGSIVTKNTEPYGVYIGCPARMIRTRQ